MPHTVLLRVDGASYTVQVDDPETPLLYSLRDELGLSNPRFGCGLGQCGACTVLIDGQPVRSCAVPVSAVRGEVTTLAGLGTPERPHPLQTAFADEQATLCGYCLNGWIMTAAALIRERPHATETEIRKGLADVKCRCGAHLSIVRAITRVTAA
jgi:aerobic-type carbon monoxide dehydrogenase small subunit (CoxS/CutS family)